MACATASFALQVKGISMSAATVNAAAIGIRRQRRVGTTGLLITSRLSLPLTGRHRIARAGRNNVGAKVSCRPIIYVATISTWCRTACP